MACADGMSARAAALHFGISRDSVRKMLSFSVPPGYRRQAAINRPKLDGFTEIIDAWLAEDRGRNRKQRHTAKRVLERLRDEHGFTGGYRPSGSAMTGAVDDYVGRNPVRPRSIGEAKLDGSRRFTEIIDAWLAEDRGRNRKQRHTAKRVLERLRDEHGFTGGYTIVKELRLHPRA